MGLFSRNKSNGFAWITRNEVADLAEQDVVVFKHSTRCAISRYALSQFERELSDWAEENELQWVLVDVLTQRQFSQAIADFFAVRHESPQLLILKQGELVAHASHESITAEEVKNAFPR